MNDWLQEEVGHLATPAEAVQEWGLTVGAMREDDAWLLHDFDVWVKNPFYSGPPVPHPEDDPRDHDPVAAQVDDLDGMNAQIDSEARAEEDRWVADQAGRLWQDESADEERAAIGDDCPF